MPPLLCGMRSRKKSRMSFISSIIILTVVLFSTAVRLSSAFVGGAPRLYHTRRNYQLHLSDGSADQTTQQPKNLSASQKARREEERRRNNRVEEGFATPGLSSAIPGAENFPFDVAKTEREYLQSLSSSDDDSVIDENNIDKYVAVWTDEGLNHLRMLRFQEASDSFNKVYQIKPEAYLWHDGLLKYYLEDYHGAAESLAKNAFRYETRFLEPASEERIWRDAAELKIVNTLNGGRMMKNEDIPIAMRVPMEEEGQDAEQSEKESIVSERRRVIRLARQLFSESLRNNPAGVALARAQLQALSGSSFPSSLKSTLPTMPQSDTKSSVGTQGLDRKMYQLHSLFYLGLHYDALGQSYESKQCMKMALKTCASSITGNSQDITYLLPVIHMTIRDWYDDDEFEEEDNDLDGNNDIAKVINSEGVKLEMATSENANSSKVVVALEKLEQRLRESIKEMRVAELKGELKKRKLKVSGSKKELQERLVDHMKVDAGAGELGVV